MTSTASTIIALAAELESIDSAIASLDQQRGPLLSRRAEILSRIAFAAGPAPSAEPPDPVPEPDPRQLSIETPAEPSEPRPERVNTIERVTEILCANPSGISVATLAQMTGAAADSLRSMLSRLKKMGKAEVISRGVWGPAA